MHSNRERKGKGGVKCYSTLRYSDRETGTITGTKESACQEKFQCCTVNLLNLLELAIGFEPTTG
jgi:hypothetical protein